VCVCVCIYYIKHNITNSILYHLYYLAVRRCKTLREQLLETWIFVWVV